MKGTLLLFVAVLITVIGFMPLLLVQSFGRNKEVRNKYHYNVAVHLDYLWGSLLFGKEVDAHTVSALVWRDKILWAIEFIDWLFGDDTHCIKAYVNEFERGK